MMSVILMTTMFYKTVILLGEIWSWLLLGLKADVQYYLFVKLALGECARVNYVYAMYERTNTY